MVEIKQKLSFACLENDSVEHISANISKELALSICAYSVERGQVTANKVLQLWMTKLRAVFGFEDFSEVDWRHLTLCCENYFNKIIYNDSKADVYLKLWLETTYDFLHSIQDDAKKFCLVGICLFLSFILDAVQKCTAVFAMHSNQKDCTSQSELATSLQNLSLKLGWCYLDNQEELNTIAYITVVSFINRICLGIMTNTYVDIKMKIETWKYVAKFALRHNTYSNNGYNYIMKSIWPKSPMNVLISEVRRNILLIYSKEPSKNTQYVEKYLRVTGFYLKVILELTTVFQHSDFPIAKELFDVLLLTLSPPNVIQNSNSFIFIKKHVLSGIISILPLVFRNNEFQQVINNYVGESGSFCFELIVSYLRAIIPSVDDEFFANNTELLKNIWERIFQSGDYFVNSNRFDEIIDIYAILTLLDPTQLLFHFMLKIIIKGNLALSFACTEVLILVSSVDNRIIELKKMADFWMRVDNKFAQFSSNIKRLNVNNFIIYISKYITQMEHIETNSFIDTHNTLRYKINGSYTTEMEELKVKLCKLMEMYGCYEISIGDYYEIVSGMYKLGKCKMVLATSIQEKIADFIEKIVNACMINPKCPFKRILTSGLVFISTCADELQLKILCFIKKCIGNDLKFPIMGVLNFLHTCCYQQNNLKLGSIAQSIIEMYTEMPDIIKACLFERVTHIIFSNSVDFQQNTPIDSKNKCTLCIRPYSPQRKRMRRYIDDEYTELEDMIENVGRTVKKIVQLSEHLKQSDLEKLHNACVDIKKITDCYCNK